MNDTYDRRNQDVGNIVALEHVNVRIPDQVLATAFYISGLGMTRDPYVMVGIENMWINMGQQQFHLPTGAPQVVPGHVGVVVPDLDALAARLEAVRPALAGTKFDCSVEDKYIRVTCPWGNRFQCYAPGAQWGDITLGVVYVEFPVPPGHAAGVKRFYEIVMGASARSRSAGGSVMRIVPRSNRSFIPGARAASRSKNSPVSSSRRRCLLLA